MTTQLKDELKTEARRLGFLLAGITHPSQPSYYSTYLEWLEHGRQAAMAYLASDSARQRRADLHLILPEVKSVLALGLPYDAPQPVKIFTPLRGQVAAYAWGEDYHAVIPPRLAELVGWVESQLGRPVRWRGYTDTGPILERNLAMQAGLGWIGKNTCLISPRAGSYFLLAEILWDVELEADQPNAHDYCGSCRRCIEACPTRCIREDRTLEAGRCISYLTIENKTGIPLDLRAEIGNWVFGCDICQQVCPWNLRFAPAKGDLAFSPQAEPARPDLANELKLSPQTYNRKYKHTPLLRPKRRGYLRNVAVALGNMRDPQALAVLAAALREELEPLVRAHAAWALGRTGGEAAFAILASALAWETDPAVTTEIKAALANC